MRKARFGNAPMVSIALLLILSPVILCATERDRPLRMAGRSSVRLQPHPDAEVIVPGLRALSLSNGSVILSFTGTGDLKAPVQGYDFEIDLALGTYMTRRISEEELRARLKNSRSGQHPEPVSRANNKAGLYRVRTYLQAKDPVDIVLTETSATLEWYVSSTGATTYNYAGDYCWANEFTQAGTTWYVDYCEHGDVWWSGGNLCNNVEGWYHNYDYLWDHLITTVHQYVQLCSRSDGSFDATASYHLDSGEHSDFITGTLYYFYY